MFATGKGVKKDITQAAKWHQKAAVQGDAEAQFNMGSLFQNGQGVKQDTTEAAKWYQKAANHGLAAALRKLGSAPGTGRKP
jgi:TPR repeat protein